MSKTTETTHTTTTETPDTPTVTVPVGQPDPNSHITVPNTTTITIPPTPKVAHPE